MIIILLSIALGVFLFYEWYWKRRNLPQGPLPLPLLGNLLAIYRKDSPYDAYITWRKEYGPVYTLWFNICPTIILADYPTIKETVIKEGHKYTDRIPFQEIIRGYINPICKGSSKEVTGGDYGVIETSGELWRDQRRFVLHILRDFGMGKNVMEQRVMTEVEAMLDRVSTQTDVNIFDELNIAVGSVINSILFGYRFDDDKLDEFFLLKRTMEEQMRQFINPLATLCLFFPFFRTLPFFQEKWKGIKNYTDIMFGYFKKQIETREKLVDLNKEDCVDFVDCFLRERHKRRDKPDFGGYTIIQLQNVIFDLWTAGLETTSNTLTFAVVFILNHPEVQNKLHEELDRVVGSNRKTVTLSDRNDLVYVNATICEAQRLSNLLPLNLMRMCTEEVEIKGVKYPKGTAIVPQISCVLYDDEVFPEPLQFKPSRFIDENGKLKKYEELIPFSVGKRQCAGEGLAKMELFLFTANLFHRYEVLCDKPPPMTKKYGTLVQPPDFKCKLKLRL